MISHHYSVLHIKDRPFGKRSVPFGTGAANFELLPKLLKDHNAIKNITLQAFRHKRYLEDINGVKHQLEFLKSTLKGSAYLSKKLALITGSTQGIGLEISTHLVQHNYPVVINGRNQDTVSNTCKTLGPNAIIYSSYQK